MGIRNQPSCHYPCGRDCQLIGVSDPTRQETTQRVPREHCETAVGEGEPVDRSARGGLQPHSPDLCHAAWQRPLLDRAGGARPEPRLSRTRKSSPAPTPRLERRLRVYPGAHRDLRADRPVHRGELQSGEMDPRRQDHKDEKSSIAPTATRSSSKTSTSTSCAATIGHSRLTSVGSERN